MAGLETSAACAAASPGRLRTMQSIKGKNTRPELLVRNILTRLGYRYRLHPAKVPGRPDVAFIGRRKAIFVHGCFWHQHPDTACPLRKAPRSNLAYWGPKLDRNRARDVDNLKRLASLGWTTLVVWECELRAEDAVTRRMLEFLSTPPTI